MTHSSPIKRFIFAGVFVAFSAHATIFITPQAPKLNLNSYVLVDYNAKKLIASYQPHQKQQPASLAKLMTAYVVFHFIRDGRANPDDKVMISEKAWKTGGSKSFIEVGKTIPLKTLLQGMIIQSGNDASVALAEHIAGAEHIFATYMNQYAAKLGMKNTHFKNASGLPNDGQYSTAFDLSLLAAATIREFPQYYNWYSQKEFTYNNIKQPNRNKLLWIDPTVDGLKTGYTKKAGYCLIASAKRDNMRLISVVLGSTNTRTRVAQTQQLLNYGFRFFETKLMTDVAQHVSILKSTQDTLKVGLAKGTSMTLPRGQFKLAKQVLQLNQTLIAPIKKGELLGKFLLTFEGKTLNEFPLIALEDAQEAGFFSRVIDSIKLWF